MNFELTQDQQQIRDTFARFCDERIVPQAAALDEAKIEPYGPGRIDEMKADPLSLVAVVPLEPVVDLKEYKSIRLPAPVVEVTYTWHTSPTKTLEDARKRETVMGGSGAASPTLGASLAAGAPAPS